MKSLIFGSTDQFAIEIGEIVSYPKFFGLYIQFRLWVKNVPVGDWNDRILLESSVAYSKAICCNEQHRGTLPFPQQTDPAEVFRVVYDHYYSEDYSPTCEIWSHPDYRDRFHLDFVGMGAIQDKYGLILVTSSDASERVIAKDLRQDCILADVTLLPSYVESVLEEYISWGIFYLNSKPNVAGTR